ncbi:MAG: anti-sigma F factor antagonist [Lachnospiraceae bacterium]|nr:anti-sigma F factor antagonist [Lachnospiraceae bacterium]MDE6253154.1 anti-sigma F factor antagonist [Lachnospiraceae bacterium]
MQVKVKGNALIIIVNGDLDHHNAEIIKEIADNSIMENKIRNVIFDFKNSNFMDSSGIGVMMGRYKLIANAGGRACAVNLNPTINRIFQISGLHKVIERFENVEDALKEYQKELKDE